MSDKRNAKLATTNRNEKIRSLEIGERLNDKFHRKWPSLTQATGKPICAKWPWTAMW